MGGGNKDKSVVCNIMEHEHRKLYYLQHNIPQEILVRNINIKI
jgi:hypothetical protein